MLDTSRQNYFSCMHVEEQEKHLSCVIFLKNCFCVIMFVNALVPWELVLHIYHKDVHFTPCLSASTAIDGIFKALGGNQLKIVAIDKVSMLSTQFLVLLDSQRRAMYNPDEPFGGIWILLIGDFVQLPVTTECNCWSVMYVVTGNNAIACNLFQLFCVYELTANMQVGDCVTHTQSIATFCKLSPKYPSGPKWTAEDNKHYKFITSDIVDGVTHEFTSEEINQYPS